MLVKEKLIFQLRELWRYFNRKVTISNQHPAPRQLSKDEIDDLDSTLYRHRLLLITSYLILLTIFLGVVADTNLFVIPDALASVYGLVAGAPPPWAELYADIDTSGKGLCSGGIFCTSLGKAILIICYIGVLGIVLSGVGTIRLDRQSRTRWRTIPSFLCLSGIAAILILSGFFLLVVAFQTINNKFEEDLFVFGPKRWPYNQDWGRILVAAWVFWLFVSLIYWRARGSRSMLYRTVRVLLATSWLEFSLALPIDIAARNRGPTCYCTRGSWDTLVVAVPMLILLVGPGLYLLYLRERELSSRDPTRAKAILRHKSAIRRRPSKIKVETHVSNARTLSLLAIALGFIALELGIFNNQRGSLFAEARELIVIAYLKDKFSNDDQLLKSMGKNEQDPLYDEIKFRRTSADQNMPFDQISITPSSQLPIPPPSAPSTEPSPPSAQAPPTEPSTPSAQAPPTEPSTPPAQAPATEPSPPSAQAPATERISILGFKIQEPARPEGRFKAEVTRNGQSWNISSFSLDRMTPDRLEQILEDLQISSDANPSKLIADVKEKLYGRHVKLPGADFWDFSTESASWMVALLCVAVLVTLRSSLRQIRRGSDTGIVEPWLILDAEVFGERALAGLWLAAISTSGWLASFGLILSVMNGFQAASPTPNAPAVVFAYLIFTVVMIFSTWLALSIVADLLRIRESRRTIRNASANDRL